MFMFYSDVLLYHFLAWTNIDIDMQIFVLDVLFQDASNQLYIERYPKYKGNLKPPISIFDSE